MAIDAELISSEAFNLKLKNYLRDFFVYQFKERGTDFKAKGTNNKSAVNKNIIDGTFYPDAKRLQFALEQSAGVTWSKGDFVDLSKGCIDKKRENKRVECITIDSRRLDSNPFFSLYQLCSESALTPGTHFSFIYTILMYFHLGRKTTIANHSPMTAENYAKLNSFLKRWAIDLLSMDMRNSKDFKWEELTDKQKQKYSEKVIKAYHTDHTQYDRILGDGSHDNELEKIHNYILRNKKKLIFKDNEFQLVEDDSRTIEKNTLFKIMQLYGIEIDSKQFGNKMQELTQLGIIKSEKRGQRIYYTLSDVFLDDLIGNDEEFCTRFADCVSFFAQTSTLGEIGSYIQTRLPYQNICPMRFKHNYIKRVLNDYNNIDLLYAIKNNLCAIIEYRNASINDLEYQRIIGFPLEIRESVTDGRQYLLYYHLFFRSVSAVRIEFIDSIILGDLPKAEHFSDDILRAKSLISHTWGTAFDRFQEGNVKTPFDVQHIRIIVCFDKNEEFIKARLQREIRSCASLKEIDTDEYGHCIEVVAEVANPWEMLQWFRSYITRVVSIEINGKEFNSFTNDVIRTYESYIEPMPKSTQNISSRTGKILLRDEVPVDFVQVDNIHSLLFNELFSIPFTKLGNTLLTIIRESTLSKSRLKQLKMDYASQFLSNNFTKVVQLDTEDKRLSQVEGFIDTLVRFDDAKVYSIFGLHNSTTICKPQDLLPLTTTEIQWLKNIISHPLAKGFLNNTEITNILDWLGNVELFDINDVFLHDQYIGMEEYYQKDTFFDSMQTIMKAIKEARMVTVKYKAPFDTESNYVCSPVHVEYSKRDNRFRVKAVSESNIVKTFNLERILDVSMINDTYNKEVAEEVIEKHFQKNECELVIFFNETKNVADRILTELSCFKKKCVKWGKERYRMTLYYDKDDRREILVRLLSYGSLINVFDDTGDVRHELIERLEHQLELTNSMGLVFATEPKETK